MRIPVMRRKWLLGLATMLAIVGSLAGYRCYLDHVPVPRPLPPGTHPVVCDGGLLGGTLDSKVVNNDVMTARMTQRMVFRCYAQTGFRGLAISNTDGNHYYIEMLNGRLLLPYNIAICGNWNPLPRPVKAYAPTAADSTAVADVLRAKRLKHPIVRITEALAADLDGDGTVEHVIAATTPTPGYVEGPLGLTSAGPDDYSIAIVVYSPDNSPRPALLEGDVHTSRSVMAVEFHLRGIYDVDGDGQMEALVDYRSSEEISGTEVYDVTKTGVTSSEMLYVNGG